MRAVTRGYFLVSTHGDETDNVHQGIPRDTKGHYDQIRTFQGCTAMRATGHIGGGGSHIVSLEMISM